MNKYLDRDCAIGLKDQPPEPEIVIDIWFSSLHSLACILSLENQKLLKVIGECESPTITELSEITGRAISNLSRTLKVMSKHNLVALHKTGNCVKVKQITSYRKFKIYFGV